MDKKTGKELCASRIGDTHSSPMLANFGGVQQVILLTAKETGGLHSFDPKTGKKLWFTDLYQNRIPITVPVQIDDKRLFASGGYDGGSKMLSVTKSGDQFEVKELWASKKGTQVHPPLVIDNHLYFLANENSNHKGRPRREKGGLVCFTLEGKELWSTGNEPFMGRGASLYADGTLIIQDGENGILRLVDPSPKGFNLLAKANVFNTDPESRKDLRYWSPLALANGRLLMRGQSKLLCLDLRK